MKAILIILLLPLVAWAQPPPLEFQLQPGAFPVYVSGFPMQQPWAGGMDDITPTFCDIDADNDLDFFCGNQTGYVSFFPNTGSLLQPALSYLTYFFDSLHVPVMSYGHSDQAFADLDGDGDLDALVGCGKILFYRNDGTPTQPDFTSNPDTLLTISGDYVVGNHLALVDINGDGDMDFVGGDYWGYLKYYENIGSPDSFAFQLVSSNWFNTYTNEGYADPCFGDLDGDGDLDLLIGTGAGHVLYYRNDGSPQVPQMTPVTNFLNIAVQKDASPELADIDGDGDLDLFVGRSSSGTYLATQGDVFFWRNDGSPQQARFTFVTSNYLTWDCGYASAPRLVDINGDGLPDLLSKQGNHLIYYRNTGSLGNPSFTYESTYFGGIEVTGLKPWFVDINGDGLLDLFAGESAIPGPPVLKLYLNEGTPQVPNWVLYPASPVPAGAFTQQSVNLSPWTADIDQDGDQDLFVSDDRGYLIFFQNTGTSTTFQFQYVTNNWQGLNDGIGGYRFGCFYDIDGDGDLDLFLNSQASGNPWDLNLRFYRNTGTPQSAAMMLESDDLFPDLMIWSAAPFVTDIDLDGDGDLFVGDWWGGIRFFRNITGESSVNPKRPEGPPERMITLLPNPGNSGTTISYVLDHPQKISLDVYNLLGAKVASLASSLQLPGNYSYTWDASAKASGIYFLRFTTPDQSLSRKITLLK